MRHVHVLIVGLGPGGSSAARVAAKAGLDVMAIDRSRTVGEPVQCAEFVPLPMGSYTRGQNVLQQQISGMQSYLPSGAVYQSDFPGFMIDRARFDQAIAEKAESAGAQLNLKTRLIALDPVARLASLRSGENEIKVTYDLLVAADGPHSSVGRFLGLPALETVNTRQYTVPLLRDYHDTDIWLSDEYPGGYAWLFPKGNQANLGLGADRRFEDNLKTPLESLHGKLVMEGLVGEEIYYRTGGAIPVGGLRERLSSQGCLFVGDAAGLTHPITGAGISAAIVSGERAGEAAVAYFDGESLADVLDDYEEDVRDQFETTIERAVKRRAYLDQHWRTEMAQGDQMMRQGWIAFSEYFSQENA
ncbi:geranylgeranyl reductase family protein [Acidihalobacter prosperus]